MGIKPPGKCKSFLHSSLLNIDVIILMVAILVEAPGFIE
jgi:hypothetical protein